MTTKKLHLKPWLRSLILILEICTIGFIIYLGGKLYSQIKYVEDIKNMNNQLIDAVLPLSNLLSKAAGSIHHNKSDYKIDIRPSLFYEYQHKTHKLELILSNPTYSLIDCTGDLAKETVYPLKVSFIWQPMLKFTDQYELICERHNNFKNLNNSKNIQRKVLLQHINAVKFKFVELSNAIAEEVEPVKFIDPKELHHVHNQQIAAVQIGMLIQSRNKAYAKEQYKNYHLFKKRFNFLDHFLHKVIYITLPSNVT